MQLLREDHPDDPGVRAMLAYQAGDEASFDELVRRYSGQVYALLTRFLGPVAAREDLLQEVFLRVIRARERYEPSARFSTWLYRIAFNLCLNESERAANRPAPALEGGAEVEGAADGHASGLQSVPDERNEPPWAELERADAVEAVRRAIAGLPAAQRMALLLAKYDGLSHAEIARVMDSNEKAIKSLIHRARENLREVLRGYLQEGLA
jgi:RNA polymerase sigma-70 factor (ECF subfamily)